MRVVFIVGLLGACSFSGSSGTPGDTPDAGPTGDGREACVAECSADDLLTCPDKTPITCPLGCDSAAGACFAIQPSNGAGNHSIDDSMVGAWVIDADVVVDTDDGSVVGTGAGQRLAGPGIIGGIGFEQLGGYAVFVVESVSITADAEVEVVGSRPLIIVSTHDVEIRGRVDASAGLADCGANEQRTCAGPGGGSGGDSNQAVGGCAPGENGREGGGADGESGGGGGGGRDIGGNGGDGTNGQNGGDGGVPSTVDCVAETIVPLTGGSGGGRGGDEDNDSHAGGGGGGGAVQISSNTAIRVIGITGTPAGIEASGEGGGGGGGSDGGGGGGSGGSILLEAPVIHLEEATLAANGGGGGGGDDGDDGGKGRFDASVAQGGGDGGSGGNGGNGGTSVAPNNGGDSFDGGGGGGAGGRIRLNQETRMMTGVVTLSPIESTGPVARP